MERNKCNKMLGYTGKRFNETEQCNIGKTLPSFFFFFFFPVFGESVSIVASNYCSWLTGVETSKVFKQLMALFYSSQLQQGISACRAAAHWRFLFSTTFCINCMKIPRH